MIWEVIGFVGFICFLLSIALGVVVLVRWVMEKQDDDYNS